MRAAAAATVSRSSQGSQRNRCGNSVSNSAIIRAGNRMKIQRAWSSAGGQRGHSSSHQQPAQKPRATPSVPPTVCPARQRQPSRPRAAARMNASAWACTIRVVSIMARLDDKPWDEALRIPGVRSTSPLGVHMNGGVPLLLDAFEADEDVYVVADGVDDLHAEVRALQDQLSRENGAIHSLGKLLVLAAQEGEVDRLGHAVHGEVAGHLVTVLDAFDGSAFEGDAGELLGVQEILAA